MDVTSKSFSFLSISPTHRNEPMPRLLLGRTLGHVRLTSWCRDTLSPYDSYSIAQEGGSLLDYEADVPLKMMYNRCSECSSMSMISCLCDDNAGTLGVSRKSTKHLHAPRSHVDFLPFPSQGTHLLRFS